jgi:hypothetical protein
MWDTEHYINIYILIFFCFHYQLFFDCVPSIDISFIIYHLNLFHITIFTGERTRIFFFFPYISVLSTQIYLFHSMTLFQVRPNIFLPSLSSIFLCTTTFPYILAPIFAFDSPTREKSLQYSSFEAEDYFFRIQAIFSPDWEGCHFQRKKHEMFWVRRFYIECCWNRLQDPISRTNFDFNLH